MTEIEMRRFCYHPEGTLGVLVCNGTRYYTIERPWLDNAPMISCIPVGTYQMGWRESPRFGWTWEVKDVENRTFVLMHVANYPKDVQGCIGLGKYLMGDCIGVSKSKDAMAAFEEQMMGLDWKLTIKNAMYAALTSY